MSADKEVEIDRVWEEARELWVADKCQCCGVDFQRRLYSDRICEKCMGRIRANGTTIVSVIDKCKYCGAHIELEPEYKLRICEICWNMLTPEVMNDLYELLC